MLLRQVSNLWTMNSRVRLRLTLLGLAVGLTGLLIEVMAPTSSRQPTELRAQYQQVNLESFRIADHFRDLLGRLTATMFDYGVHRDPKDLAKFSNASDELNRWIDDQKLVLRTDREQSVMQQIDTSYDDYLRTAQELQTRIQGLDSRKVNMEEFGGFFTQSQRLFDLGQTLAVAHQA